jgi:YVTN family beta-propeller protein
MLTDQGEIILYLQPMPQEAHKLRIIIGRIAAIREDGIEIPLTLSFYELRGTDLAGRQKLLATGTLPPGSYTGISIEVKKALLQTEEGEMALLVPEKPVTAKQTFEVKRRMASTVFLSFSGSDAITNGFGFTPVFSLATSVRQLINLVGYVSNSESNLILVFNKKTMQVVDAIATGRGPKGIALDQRRTRAYVAASGDDTVEVYDVFNGRMIGSIRLHFRDEPIDLALTPDGRTLLSVNHDSNTVSIIDATSMFELERIRVGEGPTSAVVDPLGFKAYIMNTLSSTVSVIDLTQRTATASIAVEGAPLQGAFNRAGDKLYVITRNRPNLAVIDPSRLAVTDTIFIGPGAISIKVDSNTDLILIGKKFGREITVVDPATFIFIDTIQVGGKAGFMTIDGQENTLFVAVPDKRIVQKINLIGKNIMDEIDVGEGASEVVVLGER